MPETSSESAPPPRREIWTLPDLLYFAIFFFVMLFLTYFLGLAAYAALKPVMGWKGSTQSLGQNTFFLLGVQFGFYIILFAYIYFLVAVHYRLRFWEGIKWGHLTGANILRYVAGGILIAIAVQLIPVFLPDKKHFPLEHLFSSPDSSYAVAVFAVIIAPFMEELVFRGVLFSIFETRVGLRFAIIVTAILFAAMHIQEYRGAWDHLFMIFLVGLVFSMVRGATQSLAPSVVLHITYNACLMAGLFVATSHFRMMQNVLIR
ncbi:MAG: lysostaphin resistance A-like protein [Terriglobia bacterium]